MNKFLSVVLYQFKTVVRGGLFRIFALGAIGFLGVFSTIAFGSFDFGPPPAVYGWAGSAPLFNTIILNLAQSAILIFVATDIMKRDIKYNSLEVLSVRSISNMSLTFGNALGCMLPFIVVDGINLLILMFVNIFASDSPFMWQAFLFYPLTLTIPTMFFVVGFTFFVMRLIPNQAVTVIVSLGVIGSGLIYLGPDYQHITDAHGFSLPHFLSEVAGMPSLKIFLAHRGYILFAGIAFLLFSSLQSPRLPQVKAYRLRVAAMITFFTVLALWLGNYYLSHYSYAEEIRAEIRRISTDVGHTPNIAISRYRLSVEHQDNQLSVDATMDIINPQEEALGTFYVALNPGLQITEASINDTPVPFERELHLVHFRPANELSPHATHKLSIRYHGKIDPRICYSDIDEKEHQGSSRAWIYQLHKEYAFLQSDLVLLTDEALWYPLSQSTPAAGFPDRIQRPFAHYELTVKTKPGLMAISQGNPIQDEPGQWRFKPENALPQISLAIGAYRPIPFQFDNIDCNIYVLSGLDFYEKHFGDISDSLYQASLSEIRQDFERKLGLTYPFKRFAFVEVPAQFYTYRRLWQIAAGDKQPEQMWIHERGNLLERADLRRLKRNLEWSERRSNQTFSDVEQQTTLFKRFFIETFVSVPEWLWTANDETRDKPSDNLLTPNYFSFSTFFESQRWPLFHAALEGYIASQIARSDVRRIWQQGLSDDEKVSNALSHQSLLSLLQDTLATAELKTNALRISGGALLRQLQERSEELDLKSIIADQVANHPFSNRELGNLLSVIESNTATSSSALLDRWLYESQLPGYKIGQTRLDKLIDRERIRYQVVVEIANTEPYPGVLEIRFRYRELDGRQRSDSESESEKQYILLEGNQSKEVAILLDEEPVEMTIDAKLSRNLPLATNIRFDEPILNRKLTAFEGERVLPVDSRPAGHFDKVYDNIDPSFSFVSPDHTSLLKRWIHREDTVVADDYRGLRYWRPPAQWHLFKNPGLFGQYIRSAYYIRPGNDEYRATWKIAIPERGRYRVYVHVPEKDQLLTFWQRRRGQSDSYWGRYTYIVEHADGAESIELDIDSAQPGWQLLGSYFFDPGESAIHLSDKATGQMVIADAIRISREELGE